MHRFVKLAALCAVVVAALTGCGYVDKFFGVESYEVPVLEQAVAPDGTPLFDADGKPIMRPKVDGDGKPVVEIRWRRSESGGAAGWLGAVGGNWAPWLPGLMGALGAFWFGLRKRGADKLAVQNYDNFKAIVAGIRNLRDAKDGTPLSWENIYKYIDDAARLYTDNSDAFRELVASIKAELRAESAAAAS